MHPRHRAGHADDRVRWIDAAKGIAVLSVVVMHALHWCRAAGAPTPGVEFAVALLCVPLPVFFLVSGILVQRALATTGLRGAVRVLLPFLWLYVIWQPLIVAYRVVGDVGVELHDGVDWRGELARLAATPFRPNGELWYLWALAIHILFIALTRRIPNRWILPPAFLLFALWFGCGQQLVGARVWHALGPGLQGLPMFLAWTALGARCGDRVVAFVDRIRIPAGAVLVAAWLGSAVATHLAPEHLQTMLGVPQVLLGVPATLVVARTLVRAVPTRTLEDIGHRSLPVYVLHTFTMVVVLAVALRAGGAPVLSAAPLLTLTVVTVVSTVAPLAVERAVRRSRATVLFGAPARLRRRPSRPSTVPT
jgi:surface polysaccharide O-acyltransferase-like enzyme